MLAALCSSVAGAAPFLYVANSSNGAIGGSTASGSISQFDAASGALIPLTPPSIATPQSPSGGIVVSADGRSLYVANGTAHDGIAQYSIAADGTLSPKAPPTVDADPEADLGADRIAASPNGRDVYASSGSNGTGYGVIFQFTAQADGSLASKTPSYAYGAESQGIVVSPDGKSVYMTGNEDGIYQYDVSAADGTLVEKSPSTVPTPPYAGRLAISPNGKWLFATGFGADASDKGTIARFAVAPGGELSPAGTPVESEDSFPSGIAVSPDSNSLYVVNGYSGSISQFAIGTDGSLAPQAPATVPASSAYEIAFAPNGSSAYVTAGAAGVRQFDVGPSGALGPKQPPVMDTDDFAIHLAVGPSGTASDLTPPTITISTPSEGQHVTEGAAVASSFSCGDGAGSGVASCAGLASLDTTAAGDHTFTVSATDAAGNGATKTVHYVVDASATPDLGSLPTGGSVGLPRVRHAVIGSRAPSLVRVGPLGAVRMAHPRVVCPDGTAWCRVIADAFATPAGTRSSQRAAMRKTRIAHFSYLLRPGTRDGPRFKLTKRALAVLKRKKRMRATIKIVATHDGTRTAKTIKVTLRAPARHH